MSEARHCSRSCGSAADPTVAAAIERHVKEAPDRELSRINVLDFAARRGLDEERSIAAFLHGARLGLFEMSWNVLCPGCGGVLDSNATLKSVRREEYACALCAAGYEPTLDEMVEVVFTVNPRVRRIAAHDPDTLPFSEYMRQIFWSSGIDLPEDERTSGCSRKSSSTGLSCRRAKRRSCRYSSRREFCIVFDPVTHSAQFLDVQGRRRRASARTSRWYSTSCRRPPGKVELRPGPLRLALENRTDTRVLPAVWIAGHEMHDLLGKRKPFLTAKRLLTNQTFRDIYRTDTLDVDQRLKITSLTFLFTDLKGSTDLYERVGDLVAYDMVRAHFRVLHEVVASEAGAVVKTIGDAVMATFATPDRAIAAALRMRDAMRTLNAERKNEDLMLKIGMHEGPCLAVMLNDRLDYFGQTVNIAARVQGLAVSHSIFATKPVVENRQAARAAWRRGAHAGTAAGTAARRRRPAHRLRDSLITLRSRPGGTYWPVPHDLVARLLREPDGRDRTGRLRHGGNADRARLSSRHCCRRARIGQPAPSRRNHRPRGLGDRPSTRPSLRWKCRRRRRISAPSSPLPRRNRAFASIPRCRAAGHRKKGDRTAARTRRRSAARARCSAGTAVVERASSYGERLDGVKTEMQLSDLFEDFIGRVPLGRTFFADRNPVRTAGPMQVSIAFAESLASGSRIRIRCPDPCAARYSRAAAACTSASRTCSIISAPYDRYLYRFADFNAGRYASRNAASRAP